MEGKFKYLDILGVVLYYKSLHKSTKKMREETKNSWNSLTIFKAVGLASGLEE